MKGSLYAARITIIRAYRAYRISNYPHNKQAIRSAGTLSIETTSHMFDSFADTYSRRYIIARLSMERSRRRRRRRKRIFAPDICRARRACAPNTTASKRGDRMEKYESRAINASAYIRRTAPV